MLFQEFSRVKLFTSEQGKKKTSLWYLLPSPVLRHWRNVPAGGCLSTCLSFLFNWGSARLWTPLEKFSRIKERYQHHIVMILCLISYIWLWSIERWMSLFNQCIEKWDYKAVILQMPTFVPTLGDSWHKCQHISVWYLLKPWCVALKLYSAHSLSLKEILQVGINVWRLWKGGGKKRKIQGKTFGKILGLYYSIAKGAKINSSYPLSLSSMNSYITNELNRMYSSCSFYKTNVISVIKITGARQKYMWLVLKGAMETSITKLYLIDKMPYNPFPQSNWRIFKTFQASSTLYCLMIEQEFYSPL